MGFHLVTYAARQLPPPPPFLPRFPSKNAGHPPVQQDSPPPPAPQSSHAGWIEDAVIASLSHAHLFHDAQPPLIPTPTHLDPSLTPNQKAYACAGLSEWLISFPCTFTLGHTFPTYFHTHPLPPLWGTAKSPPPPHPPPPCPDFLISFACTFTLEHTSPTYAHTTPLPPPIGALRPPLPPPQTRPESFHASLLKDAVIAGGAGGGDVVVRAHEAQVHGQQGAAHIGDGKGYAEGIHLLERLHAHTSMQDCA